MADQKTNAAFPEQSSTLNRDEAICLPLVRLLKEHGELGRHLAVEGRPVVGRGALGVDQVALGQGRDLGVLAVREEPSLEVEENKFLQLLEEKI